MQEIPPLEEINPREFAPRPPRMANVQVATTLTDPGMLEFRLRYRARRFRVPPRPYAQTMRLAVVRARLEEIHEETSSEALAEQLALLREAAAIMHQLVRPLSIWDRLTWRLRTNPFEHAEASEFGMLFASFCSARTTCRVRWISSLRAPDRWRTTRPPISPTSSQPFLRGSTPQVPIAATHSPGNTTWSA